MKREVTKPDDMAFAILDGTGAPGLTKREYFAALAMQGFCAWNHNENLMACQYTSKAVEAVQAADALIAELNKEMAE